MASLVAPYRGVKDQMEVLERRARNLLVISSSIIVYVLAGMDLDQIRIFGSSTHAEYPSVLRTAVLISFIFFWWKFQVARTQYKFNRFLGDGVLKDVQFHRDLFGSYKEAFKENEEVQAFLTANGLNDNEINALSNLTFDGENYKTDTVSVLEVQRGHRVVARNVTLPKPLSISLHGFSGSGVYARHIYNLSLKQDTGSVIVLPHIFSVIASILVIASIWWDPAGVFGLLSRSLPILQTP